LNVTPAAVGQLVRRLEENLGIELFHRSQAGQARLLITETAQAALPDLQAGFARLSAGMERLRSATASRKLILTVSLAFADKWLLHRLDNFRRSYPGCELQIDTSKTLVDFSAEQVDVGIRYGAGNWAGLTATFLARDSFFPVCSSSLLTGAHPLTKPEDLIHHKLLHDTSMASEPEFWTWKAWYAHAGLPSANSDEGLRVDDSAAVYRLAIAGQGVALGRSLLVAEDLAEQRLVRPFGPSVEAPLAYYLVCRPRDADDPRIAAFRDWLLGEISGSAADPTENPL
jgi:LysR family glycine cleavage system transcriptional activator